MPPPLLPPDSVDDFGKIKDSTQMMDTWINKTFKSVIAFVEELVKIFDSAVSILERTQVLMTTYDTFVYTRDFTIPILQVIKRVPKQTLMNEGVLKDGQSIDFQ